MLVVDVRGGTCLGGWWTRIDDGDLPTAASRWGTGVWEVMYEASSDAVGVVRALEEMRAGQTLEKVVACAHSSPNRRHKDEDVAA